MTEKNNLLRKKLFNVVGDDSIENQSIINGNSTGICNLNNIKYKWVNPIYSKMLGNFWIPEKVSMTKDKETLKTLTDEEDKALRNTLSFLIFLDSMQVNNLPNIQEHITDPAINNLLVIQQFQEVIHSQSYQYILKELYPSIERQEIYDQWRNNKKLQKRNQFVADQYEDFIHNRTEKSFKKVLVANFCLEGIYFYSGFNFFDQLASRKKLIQSSKIIDYIRRDENTHVALFLNIMREIMNFKKDRDWIYKTMDEATHQEIEWGQDIYGNNIIGVNKKSTEQHVKYLANQRLKALNLDPLYQGFDENPYSHLEGGRENFFETTVTEYDRSETISGWDEF